MLHPALLNYKPDVPCRPGDGEALHKRRMADEKRDLRKIRIRRHAARLICPDCGDRQKIRLYGRWVCRHCLCAMKDPESV